MTLADDVIMTIGEAARESGVTAKAIRYYESIGLIPKPVRTGGNYRAYDRRAVETLRFVHRARSLGFAMEDVQRLLSLWQDRGRKSKDVRTLAQAHLDELDAKILALESMRHAVAQLVEACHGDHRPDCPILLDLAKGRRA